MAKSVDGFSIHSMLRKALQQRKKKKEEGRRGEGDAREQKKTLSPLILNRPLLYYTSSIAAHYNLGSSFILGVLRIYID